MTSVLVSVDAGVLTVTLNRPEKLNALTRPMWKRLGDVFLELDKHDSVRCLETMGEVEALTAIEPNRKRIDIPGAIPLSELKAKHV